jgi:hypothetical protein
MYEQHFGDLPGVGVERPASSTSSRLRAQALVLATPSILSTLTTTERHMAADGMVTTKTVLKKRFADGREETEWGGVGQVEVCCLCLTV